jgi:hypothetical protein
MARFFLRERRGLRGGYSTDRGCRKRRPTGRCCSVVTTAESPKARKAKRRARRAKREKQEARVQEGTFFSMILENFR